MWYNRIHRKDYKCKRCGKHESTLNQNPTCAGCGKLICNTCTVKKLCIDCFKKLEPEVHDSLIKKRVALRLFYIIAIIFPFYWGSYTNDFYFTATGSLLLLLFLSNIIVPNLVKGPLRLFAQQAYKKNNILEKQIYREEIIAEQKEVLSNDDIKKLVRKNGRHKTVDILTEREISIASINGESMGSFDARIRANELIDEAISDKNSQV
ncbi:hypothetical protein NEF87_002238 [Candidatus Lokiarchaeum ossiferum]|uniref:B box-type domain-containing protein n=1 Tax=Candidatus Lokiarchaeum ossiferum TaxID=2951803 RepID=A0ABY6HR17_9ARCH|nr:hypothetical protein NEF87_002238 [Candidatus Lokiarchaeum sp. B-35]